MSVNVTIYDELRGERLKSETFTFRIKGSVRSHCETNERYKNDKELKRGSRLIIELFTLFHSIAFIDSVRIECEVKKLGVGMRGEVICRTSASKLLSEILLARVNWQCEDLVKKLAAFEKGEAKIKIHVDMDAETRLDK